jgi:rhodanese-related sulfurtransferase
MAQEVNLNDLSQALGEDAFLIDVREDWEFRDGHVPAAIHMPLSSVPENLTALPKDKKIWVICQSGGRSMTAANYLEAQGFDAVSVAGGTGGWITSGKDVSMGEDI